MFIKFRDISEKALSYLRTHDIEVYEKLDLVWFKVVVTRDGMFPHTGKGVEINAVDCIIDSVKKDILTFVVLNMVPKTDQVLDMFGECTINMCYAPAKKTHVIEYDLLDCPLFIMGTVNYGAKESGVSRLNKLKSIFGDIGGLEFLFPICTMNGIAAENLDPKMSIGDIVGGKTWSGNKADNIEGYILRCGKATYGIECVDTNVQVDKTTKKIYRDMVIDNFCNVMLSNNLTDSIIGEGSSYVDVMSNLFLSYLDNTNIFSRVSFDFEDLLPPHVGYIGDIDYDSLPVAIKYVCKTNEIYKNIFRILLVAFDPDKTKKNKNQDIDYEKFDSLKTKINSSVRSSSN